MNIVLIPLYVRRGLLLYKDQAIMLSRIFGSGSGNPKLLIHYLLFKDKIINKHGSIYVCIGYILIFVIYFLML